MRLVVQTLESVISALVALRHEAEAGQIIT